MLEYQNAQKLSEPPTLGMLQHLLRIVSDELPKSQDSQVCTILQREANS